MGNSKLTTLLYTAIVVITPILTNIYLFIYPGITNYRRFAQKTSSSRDGSRIFFFSNGTFPPGTVHTFFQNLISRFYLSIKCNMSVKLIMDLLEIYLLSLSNLVMALPLLWVKTTCTDKSTAEHYEHTYGHTGFRI